MRVPFFLGKKRIKIKAAVYTRSKTALTFEPRFPSPDTRQECRGTQGMGIVGHAGKEGRQSVAGDDKRGGHDVEIHDDFGDKKGRGSTLETPDASEKVAEDEGQAGAENEVGCEPLVLVGGGHDGGAGRPERVEDND